MIFLDNASTTMLCQSAVESLVRYSTVDYFNPSANYLVGYENFKKITDTKKHLCDKLGVKFNNNIIFTGSATEATNLAIFGSYRKFWKKAIFSSGEHPSVYNSALALKEKGVDVVFIDLLENGTVNLKQLESELNDDVAFVSIMQVSNETGAINDISKISAICKRKSPRALLHVDGVQAFGKTHENISAFDIDFYTISAHKFHGPKGLGVLYAKNPQKLNPIVYGGGQEYGLRSGTENLPAIMALDSALENLGDISEQKIKISSLNALFKSEFLTRLDKEIPVKILSGENFSPYIMSISFNGIKGQVLQNLCDKNGLLISTGSACSSKKSGNRILENMGYSSDEILGNIRVSFSRYTTEEDAIQGAKILADCANELWRNTR